MTCGARRRVVVTGVGAATPLGRGASALFEGWCDGRTGIRDGIARCDWFEAGEILSVKDTRRMDRFTQLAVVAAEEALDGAGWLVEPPVDPDNIGCVVGTGFAGLASLEAQVDRHRAGAALSPLGISLGMSNAASGLLALRYGLRGPAHSVGSACAAGADAIGTAARLIAAGDIAAALAGGADACTTPFGLAATDSAGALSKLGVSRPFDARRDGFVMGEGAGMLCLESAELAERRGASVIAEIAGYGASADAFHLTAPEPDGRGAARAIVRALHDADVAAEDLDYVNAHGTSTVLNDRSETLALKAALGVRAARVPISSTKSVIGHLCGAAGAVEAVATMRCLAEAVAPPTVGLEEPDPELNLDFVPHAPRELPHAPGRRALALSNSFGFGGHNAVLCLAVTQAA